MAIERTQGLCWEAKGTATTQSSAEQLHEKREQEQSAAPPDAPNHDRSVLHPSSSTGDTAELAQTWTA